MHRSKEEKSTRERERELLLTEFDVRKTLNSYNIHYFSSMVLSLKSGESNYGYARNDIN